MRLTTARLPARLRSAAIEAVMLKIRAGASADATAPPAASPRLRFASSTPETVRGGRHALRLGLGGDGLLFVNEKDQQVYMRVLLLHHH